MELRFRKGVETILKLVFNYTKKSLQKERRGVFKDPLLYKWLAKQTSKQKLKLKHNHNLQSEFPRDLI